MPDAGSPIRWSGKYRPASVRITAYSRQTEAGVARALIARLKAAEFLALEVGVDLYQGHCALRARALSLTTHWTGIPGAAWAAPDASSKSVAGVRSSKPSEQES